MKNASCSLSIMHTMPHLLGTSNNLFLKRLLTNDKIPRSVDNLLHPEIAIIEQLCEY